MTGFPLVIAESERDMPGIEPGPLCWYTSALTTEEVSENDEEAFLAKNSETKYVPTPMYADVLSSIFYSE